MIFRGKSQILESGIYHSGYFKIKQDKNMQNRNVFEQEEVPEPILEENEQRYVLFPIKYPSVYEMYKKHLASFWTADEVDLYNDKRDWDKLNEKERHFIKYVLAFFAASDGIVL
jgi:ribonucleoside-diphosphate reductase subunit M2